MGEVLAFPMALDILDINKFEDAKTFEGIRYDNLTKKGSVLDVVRIVTKCSQAHASETFASIREKFPDVLPMHKFPGQGQRLTPVADMPTLFRIMAILPGSRSKNFASKTADVFTRVFGGDENLENEIAKRRKTLAGTDFEHVAVNVTTTVDDALAELDKPLELPVDAGVIYIATTPWMPLFKLGFWTGTQEALESRYKMYYGPELQLETWMCVECRVVEKLIMEEFLDHNAGGELFSKDCLDQMKLSLTTRL